MLYTKIKFYRYITLCSCRKYYKIIEVVKQELQLLSLLSKLKPIQPKFQVFDKKGCVLG